MEILVIRMGSSNINWSYRWQHANFAYWNNEGILGSRITRDMICTRNNDGSGLCANDRGSPLVAGLQLIGIASSSEGCGTTRPVRYEIKLFW